MADLLDLLNTDSPVRRAAARTAITMPRLVIGKSGISQALGGSFDTIMFSGATPMLDTANGWNASTSLYTVQEDGLYRMTGKMRLQDNTGSNVQYGIGLGKANADTPDFLWTAFPSVTRFTGFNQTLQQYVQGDQLRMFGFGNGIVDVCQLIIERVA